MRAVAGERLLLDELAPSPTFLLREHTVVDTPPQLVYDHIRRHRPDDRLVSTGWEVLGTRADEQVVFSAAARFWTPLRHRHRISAEGWSAVWEPHLCGVVAGFTVLPYGGRTLLTCELHLTPEDPDAATGFGVYWHVLAPAVRILVRRALRDIGRGVAFRR